jgi:hypothetical protein
MTNEQYEKILREGEKVDWYGAMVPEELLTPKVRYWCSMVVEELNKLEASLSDLKGTSKEKRQNYINGLWNNVRNAPYTLNNDVYMKKRKRIEAELEEKEKPKKTTRKRRQTTKKKTTTKASTTSKKTSTKNSSLIFGKKQ